jgi:hypothetical protein
LFANLREYLRQPAGRTAASIVLICGLMLGYFVCRTFVEPLPRQYAPYFGNAKWIQVSQHDRAAYFRKDLYVPGPVERSWLVIAATGSYQLIVNNVAVDQAQLPGARLSGLYDITNLLSTGKNAIAVYVPGSWFDDALQICVRGSLTIAGAKPQEFLSDASWKATPAPRDIPGGLRWSAPAMDDELWPHAQETGNDGPQPAVQPLLFDPRLIESTPGGSWIAPASDGAEVASFSYDLALPGGVLDGWLEVAANGNYDVIVNGRLAATASHAPQARALGQNAPLELDGGGVITYRQLPAIISPRGGLPGPEIYSAIAATPPGVAGSATAQSSQPQVGTAPPSVSGSIPGPSPAGGAKVSTTTNPAALARIVQQPAAISTASIRGIAENLRQILRIPRSNSAQESNLATIASRPAATLPNGGAVGTRPSATAFNSAPKQTGNSQQRMAARGQFTLRPQPLLLPLYSVSPGLTPPSLTNFSVPALGNALQLIPSAESVGPVPGAALELIAYNIRDWVHPGNNQIVIRVRAPLVQGPPVLFANGFADAGANELHRFHTDASWRVVSSPGAGTDGSPERPRVFGAYGDAPWGVMPIVVASQLWLPGQDVRVSSHWLVTIVSVTVSVILFWTLATPLLLGSERYDPGWNFDALFHFVALVSLAGLFALSYDIRFPYDWCFRPSVILGIVVFLGAGKLLLLFARLGLEGDRVFTDRSAPNIEPSRWSWQLIPLLAITIVGTIIRASNLTSIPMGHDETIMVLLARSVLKSGYPFIHAGSYTRLLSTYELLPYPIALSIAIFGEHVLAYRLPALIFSSATIALIGYVGYRMMGWRTGILAATIWALLPIPIGWARDGFYPSQECFFSLATFWLFYESIREEALNRRALTLTAIAFVLSYLSWEASGFILPTLIVALLVVRWGEFSWMRDGYLWRCFGVVATIVIVQLSYRQLTLIPDYLGVVRDLSEVTSPSVVFLDRLVFDPFYYVNTLFLAENHVALTILTLSGLLFVRRNQALLYLCVSLATLYIFYTCFLDHYAPRYCFNWLPLLVLAGAGSCFALFDSISRMPVWAPGRWLGRVGFAFGTILLIAASNQYGLNLFRSAPDPANPVWYDRVHVAFKADYFGPNEYVAAHLEPGDVVIASMPHCYYLDTGHWADYSINTRLEFRMYYDGGTLPVTYIDKWLGVKAIHNLDELMDVHTHGGRVWIIQNVPDPNSAPVLNYLQANGRVVYESTAQQVILLEGSALPLPSRS